MVVLAAGRTAGSGASSARTAGPRRGPILAGTGSGISTEHGLAWDPTHHRVVCLPMGLRHANRQQHCSADVWGQVLCPQIRNGAEQSGKLTVEEALDCATRLPQALFCSMMECLAENGEDPEVIVAQVARLHDHMLRRLREVAVKLQVRSPFGLH